MRLLASVKHPNVLLSDSVSILVQTQLLLDFFEVVAYKEAFWDDKTRCLCIVQVQCRKSTPGWSLQANGSLFLQMFML